MDSKRVISGLIIALGLVGCQGASTQSPPTSTESSSPQTKEITLSAETVRQGRFADAERPTSGEVELARVDKTYHVVLGSNFQTSKGPDLQVVLHRSSNLLSELSPPTFPLQASDYVVIGNLKSLKGEQSYSIPSNIKVEEYGSVAIWCEKFNATFGAANLSPG